MSLCESPFGVKSFYQWGQTAETIDVTFPVSKNVLADGLVMDIGSSKIVAGVKGSDAVVQGLFWGEVASSAWQIEANMVTVHLDKTRQNEHWPVLIRGPVAPNERIDPTSDYELGKHAEFTLLNEEEAAEHYRLAARRGHLQAQLKMAHLLTSGFLKPTTEEKIQQADTDARLYLDMAIMMHNSPEAMVYLAKMEFTPEPQKRKWLAEAATKCEYAPAMYLLGLHDFSSLANKAGWEAEQTSREILRWWRKAASLDEARACAQLGLVYLNGTLGENPNPREADELFVKARQFDPMITREFEFPSQEVIDTKIAEWDKLQAANPLKEEFLDFPVDSIRHRDQPAATQSNHQQSGRISPAQRKSPRSSVSRASRPHREHSFSSSFIGGAVVALGFVVGAFVLHKFVSNTGSASLHDLPRHSTM